MSRKSVRAKRALTADSAGPRSDKLWRNAIMMAVKQTATDGKTHRLNLLATRLVKSGLAGDTAALREIGDRLDGKPSQTVNYRRINSMEDLDDSELENLARGEPPITTKGKAVVKGSKTVN